MIWLVGALGTFVTILAIRTGNVGVRSAAVSRRSEPGVYWFTVSLLGAVTFALFIAAAAGSSFGPR